MSYEPDQGEASNNTIQMLATVTGQLGNLATAMERLGHLFAQAPPLHAPPPMPPPTQPEPEPPDHAWRFTWRNSHQTSTRSQLTTPSYYEKQPANEYHFYPFSGRGNCLNKKSCKKIVPNSKDLIFSGYSGNPEDYLRWETNMKHWLKSNDIPKDEKLSYAVEALIGDAYKWWRSEAIYTTLDWRELKRKMYKEFVKKYQNLNNIKAKLQYQAAPHKRLDTGLEEMDKEERSQVSTNPNDPRPDPSPPKLELLGQQLQGKSFIPLSLPEVICHRCQGLGHIARACPTKSLENCTSLGLTRNSLRKSDISVETNLNIPNSSMLHLSLSKRAETGLGKASEEVNQREHEEEKVHALPIYGQTKDSEHGVVPVAAIIVQSEVDQSTTGKGSFKEKPPDQMTNTESDRQVSFSLSPFVSHEATVVSNNLLDIKEHEKKHCLKHSVDEGIAVTSAKELDFLSLSPQKEPMMHLSLVQSVEIIPGIKEIESKEFTPDQRRGVILSYLFKGEPPDVSNHTKPQAYRGKTLDSQRRMKANLLSLGADYTVSRSKPFEEGGYDEDIKSPPPKEHKEDIIKLIKTLEENQLGRTKDIGVLIGAYLPNHEGLIYELTCSGKLTQQGITGSWNHSKPGSELEVIKVTSWQTGFTVSSAIGPKMELHSPTHSQSRPQTTWRMLMDLSRFQKAQETQKHPKEAQVITKLPQHVYLDPSKGNARLDQLSSIQTYTWRPGEVSMHSGDCKMSIISGNQDVPRSHLFLPKLSRYKDLEPTLTKDALGNCTLFPTFGFVPLGFPKGVLTRQHP